MKFSKNYRKSTRFSIFKNLKIFKLPVIFGWLNSYKINKIQRLKSYFATCLIHDYRRS
ncbi:hypothetical protein MSIBF_A1300001 [groundwater metagenome]|uniref:Uncharacterized protein n=1 Tax=groundwater metagenome TaxID=717931 RepID=A0A098E601_9ZZZZ